MCCLYNCLFYFRLITVLRVTQSDIIVILFRYNCHPGSGCFAELITNFDTLLMDGIVINPRRD